MVHIEKFYYETMKLFAKLDNWLLLNECLKKKKKQLWISQHKTTATASQVLQYKSLILYALWFCIRVTDIRQYILGLLQMAQCNFTPITSSPQCIAQSHDSKILSNQLLWELLEAVSGLAIMGILRRVHKSYFSSVQITVLNGVLGSENMINQL